MKNKKAKEYYNSTRLVESRHWTLEMAMNFADEYHEQMKKDEVDKNSNKAKSLLGRINDYVRSKSMNNHQKIINIWLLTNNREDFPALPPLICPCEITLKDGSKHNAYMDTDRCADWIQYGRVFKRKYWSIDEVIDWKFI